MSALVHPLIRQAIGILLLWSGIVKFADLTGTRESITAYRLLPTGWVRVAALVLPLSEVSLAALLLLGNSPVVALSGVGLLFVIFASAQVINLVRGIRVPCGCFGPTTERTIGWPLVAFDLSAATLCTASAIWQVRYGVTEFAPSMRFVIQAMLSLAAIQLLSFRQYRVNMRTF